MQTSQLETALKIAIAVLIFGMIVLRVFPQWWQLGTEIEGIGYISTSARPSLDWGISRFGTAGSFFLLSTLWCGWRNSDWVWLHAWVAAFFCVGVFFVDPWSFAFIDVTPAWGYDAYRIAVAAYCILLAILSVITLHHVIKDRQSYYD